MKEQPHHPRIEPELEARIVALVLGEASDFEREELERLIDQRLELTMLKKRIEGVHGLLRDVTTGESTTNDDNWKLSDEKRSTVLAVIDGEAKEKLEKNVVQESVEKRKSRNGHFFWNFSKIAAVLCVMGFIASMTLPAFHSKVSTRTALMRRMDSNQMASKMASTLGDENASEPYSDRYSAHATSSNTTAPEADAAAVAERDYVADSKSALSAIQGSLGSHTSVSTDAANGPEPLSLGIAGKPGLSAQGPLRSSAATSKEAVDGLEPKSWEIDAGKPSSVLERLAEDGADWFADSHEITLRPMDSKPALQSQSGKADLSFPELGDSPGDRYASTPAEPAIPLAPTGTRSIALPGIDELAIRDGTPGGGSKSTTETGSGQQAVLGEPLVISGFEATGVKEADRGTNQRLRMDAGRKALPDSRALVKATEPFSAADPAQGRRLSRGEPTQADSNSSQVSNGREGAGTAGMDVDANVDGIWAYVESLDGGGGFGGGRGDMLADQGRKEIPAERKPRENAQRNQGQFGYDGAAKQPSESMAAGRGGGAEKKEAERSSGSDAFTLPASLPPVPTAAPMSSREGIERKSGSSRSRSANQPVANAPATLDKVASETEKQVMKSRRKPTGSTKLSINATTGAAALGRSSGSNEIDPILERFQRPQIEPQTQHAPSGTQDLALMVTPRILIVDESLPRRKTPVNQPAAPAGLNEKTAADEAFSTFSLHVGDVSFKLAQAALAKGEWPEGAKVRIEEFVNAFDYGDPMPSQSEKVACCLEQTIHPFLQQRNLLRVSMRTAAAGRSGDTPLRLTFLLDNSGSMERVDRQETVRRAFALLAQQLKPIDQVTLLSFARQPRLLADKVSGAQSDQLVQLIGNLPSEGGTNFEAALQLAFEKAREQQVDHAQNRIIMLTDGAANLGDANPESLARMIETMRNSGLAFDAAGISAEGLNDEILEALTRKGDGRYYLLDLPEDADDGFARQIAGALRPTAKNVKVQIEFNPKRVGHYKLLGFEKHRLKKEDFRNDQVDAAEMAAAEAGVAVYQFEAKPDGEGDVGSVSVRFRDMSTGQMVENRWPIPYEADAPRLDQAAPSLRIATSAALLAAKLRGDPLGETVDLKTLSNLIAGLPERTRNARRVQQLQQMIHQARQVSRE